MKVEIRRREIIKPSSPTPSHLKTFKLSLLDQLQPLVYGPVISFYPKNDITSDLQRSQQLKKSLSESLARFYPIAGRINNNTTIECNDEGAPFVEARISGQDLSTFLHQPLDHTVLQRFLPAAIESPEAGTWPLLLVQATFFNCGGLALGLCMSHKLADATTVGIFMKSWAQTSSGWAQPVVPALTAAAYFPPRDILSAERSGGGGAIELRKMEGVTKRFVFDKSKILDLKAKTAGGGGVRQPTRVEVVTALIWKCIMGASRESNPGGPTKFVLTQAMNIRKRVDPPLPENLVGNIVGYFAIEMDYEKERPSLRDLVSLMRKRVKENSENKAKRLGGGEASELIYEDFKEAGELFRRDDANVLIFTSFCNLGSYEALDFGWGKPVWVTVPGATGYTYVVTLMDTREGNGVEAWVTLAKQDMGSFESHPQLLQFACPSPIHTGPC